MGTWIIAGVIIGAIILLAVLYIRSPIPAKIPSLYEGMTDEDIAIKALLDDIAFESTDPDL